MHDHHLNLPILEAKPKIHPTAFIASNATLVSRTTIEENASVWFQTVLRGDINEIIVEKNSNIQDGSVIHVTNQDPCIVRKDVSIGHHVNLHGCEIESGSLIGIGAIILSGARVSKECIVAAGAVVKEKTVLESGFLYAGVPAKQIRKLTPAEIENNYLMVGKYVKLSEQYRTN